MGGLGGGEERASGRGDEKGMGGAFCAGRKMCGRGMFCGLERIWGGAHEGVPRDGLIGFARAVRVFFDVMKKAARDGVWRGAGIAVLALCHCGRVCECVNLTCRRQFETRVTAQSLRSYRANFGQRASLCRKLSVPRNCFRNE